MSKHWFVVQAYSGQEKRAKALLEERIEMHDMQDKFGDILVPTEEVYELKDGKKCRSERKFYPGYMLVNIEMDEDAWHLVRRTSKIIGFVGGTAERPVPVSESEISAILARLNNEEGAVQPKEVFEAGELVRVSDGPFSDFDGTIEQVNYEKNRLRVAVTIFGRSTPVELEFDQVVKV